MCEVVTPSTALCGLELEELDLGTSKDIVFTPEIFVDSNSVCLDAIVGRIIVVFCILDVGTIPDARNTSKFIGLCYCFRNVILKKEKFIVETRQRIHLNIYTGY